MIDPELQPYFRDVHDHLLRVNAQVDQFRDLLSTALGANLTQINVRQSEDMRRITAWVAIAAVPTAVAGIYGMNFDHMPELQWEFGYPAVLLVILIDLPVPLPALPPRRLALNTWVYEPPGVRKQPDAACASDRAHAALDSSRGVAAGEPSSSAIASLGRGRAK